MYPGSTQTFSYKLDSDASAYKGIQVVIRQENVKISKYYRNGKGPEGMSVDGAYVYVRLSQQETGAFSPGVGFTQVRVLTDEDNVIPSPVMRFTVKNALDKEILT